VLRTAEQALKLSWSAPNFRRLQWIASAKPELENSIKFKELLTFSVAGTVSAECRSSAPKCLDIQPQT
jgi:hypothetical protein